MIDSATGGLVAYRPSHAATVTGAWIPDELLCFAHNDLRSPVTAHSAAAPWPRQPDAAPPSTQRLLVAPGIGFIRFSGIEPVHRRARLEVGIQGAFDQATAEHVLALAQETAFFQLNLHRIFGWLRPSQSAVRAVLETAGFTRELAVPFAARENGHPVVREIWGKMRGDHQ